MKNSQIIDILRSLTKKEVRDLKKWLVSPAHNHRKDVVKLFDYFLAGDHLNNDKFLEKEKIFNKIYPREKFDDAKLRQCIHFLSKTTEDYLVYKEQKRKPISSKLALARVYKNKNIDKAYSKVLNSAFKLQDLESVQDDQYFYNHHLLLEEDYDIQIIEQITHNLEVSFIIKKLKLSCLMVNHQRIYKKEFDLGLFEPILSYIEDKGLLEIAAIRIYYYYYKSIVNVEDESNYYKFRDAIFTNDQVLSRTEMRDIYLLALNYAISKANRLKRNQLKVDFKKEVFELYKKGIENEILFSDEGHLSNLTFYNTVSTGINVKEFSWVKNFIQEYQIYLLEDDRELQVQTALGKFYFEQENYDKARDYLIQVNPNDVLTTLNVKSMLLRIYYHEDEFQLLDALLESMKAYVNRKKLLVPRLKLPFMNLIKVTKKLMNVNPYDKQAKTKLRKEIEETPSLIAKDWFLEQVDKL